MSKISKIYSGPCQHNETKLWHYCMIHGDNEIIYPVGLCRENNKKGKTPCNHTTEEQALECYRNFEREQIKKGLVISINDVLLPEHRPYFEKILLAKKEIEELYEYRKGLESDINHHLTTLRAYASKVNHVTEFGVREGNSTIAFFASPAEKVVSYDINECKAVDLFIALYPERNFTFRKQDVIEAGFEIEPTDMLFIDTKHTYNQIKAELAQHAKNVRCYIAFHDIELFGYKGEVENEGGGILPAIEEFMKANPEWVECYRTSENNGLLIIERK